MTGPRDGKTTRVRMKRTGEELTRKTFYLSDEEVERIESAIEQRSHGRANDIVRELVRTLPAPEQNL